MRAVTEGGGGEGGGGSYPGKRFWQELGQAQYFSQKLRSDTHPQSAPHGPAHAHGVYCENTCTGGEFTRRGGQNTCTGGEFTRRGGQNTCTGKEFTRRGGQRGHAGCMRRQRFPIFSR
eukprot:700419-Prorocentrum_minimum.AAC.1